MRITPSQIGKVRATVNRILGEPHQIWLFGSRADDKKRGGDLDLMIETEAVVPNRAAVLCRLYGALIMALGDRKLDILLKDARTGDAQIFEIARRTGLRL